MQALGGLLELCAVAWTRIAYATSLDTPGAVQLWPWMLAFRADFGLPELHEPQEAERLFELVLTETQFVCKQICHCYACHGP